MVFSPHLAKCQQHLLSQRYAARDEKAAGRFPYEYHQNQWARINENASRDMFSCTNLAEECVESKCATPNVVSLREKQKTNHVCPSKSFDIKKIEMEVRLLYLGSMPSGWIPVFEAIKLPSGITLNPSSADMSSYNFLHRFLRETLNQSSLILYFIQPLLRIQLVRYNLIETCEGLQKHRKIKCDTKVFFKSQHIQ